MESMVIVKVPMVNPDLVGDLAVLIVLGRRDGSSDGVPCTNGVKLGSNKGRPLLVVGALESGDMGDEGDVGGGHFVRGLVLG